MDAKYSKVKAPQGMPIEYTAHQTTQTVKHSSTKLSTEHCIPPLC